MNKLIIFDLDGVLIDSKKIHFLALNKSLANVDKKYIITKKEQKKFYEGLPTSEKLKILTKQKGLANNMYKIINQKKQEYVYEKFSKIKQDKELIKIFIYLKNNNFNIAVASNSIRKTLDLCLSNLGISKYVDISFSNEDVKFSKPDPEIYIKILEHFNLSPNSAIIFEDSEIGIKAAKASGAHVIKIKKRSDISLRFIKRVVSEYFE